MLTSTKNTQNKNIHKNTHTHKHIHILIHIHINIYTYTYTYTYIYTLPESTLEASSHRGALECKREEEEAGGDVEERGGDNGVCLGDLREKKESTYEK